MQKERHEAHSDSFRRTVIVEGETMRSATVEKTKTEREDRKTKLSKRQSRRRRQ